MNSVFSSGGRLAGTAYCGKSLPSIAVPRPLAIPTEKREKTGPLSSGGKLRDGHASRVQGAGVSSSKGDYGYQSAGVAARVRSEVYQHWAWQAGDHQRD